MAQRIGRRELLMGAGAGTVALATIGVSASPAAAERRDRDSDNESEAGLAGAWLVSRSDQGGPTQTVVTFGAGGDLDSRDLNPPGPPGLGAWAEGEDDDFVATFYSSQPQGPPGSPLAIVKVIVHGTRDDDNISGTYTFEVRDGSGSLLQSGNGTFSGTRIVAGH